MGSRGSLVDVSRQARRFAALALLAAPLAGCLGYDGVINRGAIVEERKVSQVKVGLPAPQVLTLIGTPSTTSTIGGDAWYYFSQRIERELAFMPPQVADQHILAIYFDKSKKVQRIADYGMQDGKVVDFLTRTMPTAGAESSFIRNMLTKLMSF